MLNKDWAGEPTELELTFLQLVGLRAVIQQPRTPNQKYTKWPFVWMLWDIHPKDLRAI